MLVSLVDIKHDAFGGFSRRGKLIGPDGATVGTQDVADADGLGKANEGTQYNGNEQRESFHIILFRMHCKNTRII